MPHFDTCFNSETFSLPPLQVQERHPEGPHLRLPPVLLQLPSVRGSQTRLRRLPLLPLHRPPRLRLRRLRRHEGEEEARLQVQVKPRLEEEGPAAGREDLSSPASAGEEEEEGHSALDG